MTLRIHIRAKASCSRHPRYDPARDGESAIKGGCVRCKELFGIHCDVQRLEARTDSFLSGEELARQARGRVKQVLGNG